MSSMVQPDGFAPPHSRPTAESGARPAPPAQGDPMDVGRGSEWLNSHGANGHPKGTQPSTRVVGGRWVQVAYAMIDVVCVLVNGAIAFLLRFSPADLRHWLVSGHLTLTTDQPVTRYGGFLLLYVALILLFCPLP